MSKELKKAETRAVAAYDYGEHTDKGFEGQTQDDVQMPFVALLQSLSPQVDKDDDSYIQGAEPGKLFNTVTRELYGKEVTFVPAVVERCYIEWVPREDGGGFVARHERNSDIAIKAKAQAGSTFGKLKMPGECNNDLIDTVYMYGVIDKGPDVRPELAVVAFTSTKLAVYRNWNTQVRMLQVPGPGDVKITPPLYAHKIRIGSIPQVNTRKQKFHNLTIDPANGDMRDSLLLPEDRLFQAAVELRDLVQRGVAKAADETQAAGASKADTEDGGGAF